MSELQSFLISLQSVTPLGLVALSLLTILMLVRQYRSTNLIKDNHLHEIKEILGRIETGMADSQKEQTTLLNDIKTGIEVIKVKMHK